MGGLWAFVTACGREGMNPPLPEPFGVGFLLGVPFQSPSPFLPAAASPLQLFLLVEDFASGSFSYPSLPHSLFSLILRILETLWLSFAYVITQKRQKKPQ